MIERAILTAIADRLTPLGVPLSSRFLPLRVDGREVGYLDDTRARRLMRFTDVFLAAETALVFVPGLADCASRTAAVDYVARTLAAEGLLSAWRDERYAVVYTYGEDPCFLLERAAARYFGIRTFAAHVNGVVATDDSERIWIARRSATKSIDPGMLDNTVGGGIAAGMDARRTLVKEAHEEAGIPEDLARRAVAVAQLSICRIQREGLQYETVFAHDLALPSTFVPCNQDGEVAEWRLVGVEALARILASSEPPDCMTADASVVCLDWLLRRGHAPVDTVIGARLATIRSAHVQPAVVASAITQPREASAR